MKKFTSIIVATFLAINFCRAQTSVTLQPDSNSTQNATVTDYFPNGQYSADEIFQGSAWTWSGTPTLFRSLLQFDLTQIPSSAIVDSAFISLYGYVGPNDGHSTISGTNESELIRITSPWNENTVTWNTQPSTTITDAVILPASNFAGEDYLHFDITALVQYWVSNPLSNYGMFYRLQNEQMYRRMSFHSPTSSDSTRRPMLVITYRETAQTCITLQPDSESTQNATVTDYYPNGQYSADEIFQGSAWTWTGTPVLFRSLLQFDLIQIPSNAIVDSAFITLFGYVGPNDGHSTISGTNESELMRITSPWNENAVTWNTQPSTTTTDEVILPASNFAGEDYLHYNIRDMVQYWVTNPGSNYGLFYKLQNEQMYRRMSFHSPTSSDSARRPMLKICYSIPESVNENIIAEHFTIYPNPSTGRFKISFRNIIKDGSVEIFNLLGVKIHSQKISAPAAEANIDLNSVPGIYIVKLITQQDERVIKFVKQ